MVRLVVVTVERLLGDGHSLLDGWRVDRVQAVCETFVDVIHRRDDLSKIGRGSREVCRCMLEDLCSDDASRSAVTSEYVTYLENVTQLTSNAPLAIAQLEFAQIV